MYDMKFNYLFLSIGLLLMACNVQKKASQEPAETENGKEMTENTRPEPPYTTGTIRVVTGLDGCGLLIYADDGKKYQPIEIPEWAGDMKDGMRVKFAFDILENVISTCMAEDANIRLNQILPLDVEPRSCVKVEDPYEVDWLAPIVNVENPTSITEFSYAGERAYYLQCGEMNYLYHCRGYLICEIPDRTENECAKRISTLQDAKVIWVRNN